MDETEIDLSSLSIIDACHWLLASIQTDRFIDMPYTIPFSSYVMTWHRSVPLNTIIVAQSPYPNKIFPPIAAAMSYDTDSCIKEMKGRTMPPTVQVLANDLYINAGFPKEDTINILKNGWALIDKGIIMINESIFHPYEQEEGYLESIKQCSVIIRLLQETEKYGKQTINVYAFGEAGERVGSNICSWYKSSIISLTKRKVTHPAGIARRFDDLDSPSCHMATSSFSQSLVRCFSNHVAFMYSMAKKTEQDIRAERLSNTFSSLTQQFPLLNESLVSFTSLQKELSEMPEISQNYKETLEKVVRSGETLSDRFRIAGSIVNNLQSHGSSVAGSVSKPAPSMRGKPPSSSAMAEHIGQEPDISMPSIQPGGFKLKKSTPRKTSTTRSSSFTNIDSPPSISSVQTEAPTPGFKLKSKATPNSGLKNSQNRPSTPKTEEDKTEAEEHDVVSPLTNKFTKKILVPKSKEKEPAKSNSKSNPFASKALSKQQINSLSCIRAIIESIKPEIVDDEDYSQDMDNIDNDIQAKTQYNSITEILLECINKDIDVIPGFDLSKYIADDSKTCSTVEKCKEEYSL